MDARSFGMATAWLLVLISSAHAQLQGGRPPAPARRMVVETTHFRVFAADPQLAHEVGQMAEEYRRHLALHWLAKELPPWMEKVPINVQSAPGMPASGETKYTLVGGMVRNFQMVLCGSRERILDSVLPHEMTHTVLASHFAASGKPVPRWADEGACTTVEHNSERSKHDTMLVRFLSEGRGIPFKNLFAMRDYPSDMMPLYAQGYSLCAFLIAQGGPRQFIRFLESGMRDEDWDAAIMECYGYPRLGKLQTAWNQWVSDGGGTVSNYTAVALGHASANATLVAVQPNPAVDPKLQLASASVGGTTPSGLNPRLNSGIESMAGGQSGGYYQLQFQRHSSAQVSPDALGSPQPKSPQPTDAALPVHVGQPGPMQTMGGTIYR